ncbi:MAG: hypothetical protein GF387_01045 [Candidatus Portnoybacteria bacterium]|nr:hypothetical protein [Candidatus Portnoybacteria bacterium]
MKNKKQKAKKKDYMYIVIILAILIIVSGVFRVQKIIDKEKHIDLSYSSYNKMLEQGSIAAALINTSYSLKCDFDNKLECYSKNKGEVQPRVVEPIYSKTNISSGYLQGKLGSSIDMRKWGVDMLAYPSSYLSLREGTIDFWIKTHFNFHNSNDGMAWSTFFRYGELGKDLISLYRHKRTNKISLVMINESDFGQGVMKVVSLLANGWQDTSEWHHITISWDKNELRLYIDGELRNSKNEMNKYADNGNVYIATEPGIDMPDIKVFPNFYVGSVDKYHQAYAAIDELGIYNYARGPMCNDDGICNDSENGESCPFDCGKTYKVESRIGAEGYDWVQGADFVNLTNEHPGPELVVGFSKNYMQEYENQEGQTYRLFEGIVKAFYRDNSGNWKELWTYQDEGETYPGGVSSVGDIDNDGEEEVVITFAYTRRSGEKVYEPEERKQIVLLEGDGTPKWTQWVLTDVDPGEIGGLGEDVMLRDVAVADIITDYDLAEGKEIITVGGSNTGKFNGGQVVILNASNGRILLNEDINRFSNEIIRNWVYKLQSIETADINNDGKQEIIAIGGWGSSYGNVHALSMKDNYPECMTTGCLNKLWRTYVPNDALGVSINDFDKYNPGLEIAVPSANRSEGSEKTTSESLEELSASGLISPVGECTEARKITLLNNQGEQIWQYGADHLWSAGEIDDNLVLGYGASDIFNMGTERGGVMIVDAKNPNTISIVENIKLPRLVMFLKNSTMDNKEYILASCYDGNLYLITK